MSDSQRAMKRAPMDSMRKTALVAGIFYLITFISIPTLALYGPVKTDPSFILSAGGDIAILVGGLLEMIVALAGIGTAVALYSVLKRQHEGLALGLVTTRIFEGAGIAIGVMSILSVVTLRAAAAAGGDPVTLTAVGQAQVANYNWAFLLSQSLVPGLNALLLGTLMYRSRLVPRFLPVLGLIGAPILLVATTATLFGFVEQWTTLPGLAALPIAAWELSLGLWLTFKGFNRSSPLFAATVEAGTADDSTPAIPSRPALAPKAGLA